MKMELKRDDPSLKDITIELEPGDYYNPAQYTQPVKVSVLNLVEFYEEWLNVATQVKYFAALKQSAKRLLKEIEELGAYYDEDPDIYLGGEDDDQVRDR